MAEVNDDPESGHRVLPTVPLSRQLRGSVNNGASPSIGSPSPTIRYEDLPYMGGTVPGYLASRVDRTATFGYSSTLSPEFEAQYPEYLRVRLQDGSVETMKRIIRSDVADLTNVWFFRVLESMGRDDGFAMLMILLPIYERYVVHRERVNRTGITRFNLETSNGVLTANGRRIAGQIATDWKLDSVEEAAAFWWSMRNGLLHDAAFQAEVTYRPTGDVYTYELSDYSNRSGKMVICRDRGDGKRCFYIDPVAIREQLVPLLKECKEMWESGGNPLPGVISYKVSVEGTN